MCMEEALESVFACNVGILLQYLRRVRFCYRCKAEVLVFWCVLRELFRDERIHVTIVSGRSARTRGVVI